MRKFIMSDIHGFGNVYYSMMNYLDNLSESEEIELYIDGDLIDRGHESAKILLDVINRMTINKFKITYLGGNHELMMYEAFLKRKEGTLNFWNDWYFNGGYITDKGITKTFRDKDTLEEVGEFIGSLRIYHKFQEKIGNKRIVLVHAACPMIVKDHCNMLIKEKSQEIFDAVWMRQYSNRLGRYNHIGNKDYFTIVGHTPNNNPNGFEYYNGENVLNIDGGCACYLHGSREFNHFPLVEVLDNSLRILTFNCNNEIIRGNYFVDKIVIPFSNDELEEENKYLIKNKKIKS